MLNPILENCYYHSNNPEGDTRWITCSVEDFQDIYKSIHKDYRPFVRRALHQMKQGVTFSFWFVDKKIVFEG